MRNTWLYLHNILAQEYHRLSLWYFVSFIFGIIYFLAYRSGFTTSEASFVFLLLSLLAYYWRLNLIVNFLAICLICFFLGIITAEVRLETASSHPINRAITSKIIGRVEDITPTTRGSQIILDKVQVDYNNLSLNKVRINVNNHDIDHVNNNDLISLRAKLFPLPKSVLTGTYDFGFYMSLSGIEATGYSLSTPEVIAESNYKYWQTLVQNIRHHIYLRLIEHLGTEQGNVVAAILIGYTKGIPDKTNNNMRNSGIAHILSVSGLHLSLVAAVFFVSARILLNLSNFLAFRCNIKTIAGIISIIGSFLYLLLSGSKIAATRAFIMTSIFIVAMLIGRLPYPLRSVMIAAGGILVFIPEYSLHPSFQLSFSAVLCLISGYELLQQNSHLLGRSKGLAATLKLFFLNNIYSSFLSSIMTAPFVIYHFYKLPVYGVIMNLIAVPMMSFIIMPLGVLAIILTGFNMEGLVLKILGFFIHILIISSDYMVSLPAAIWYTGYISGSSLCIFAFGFFWICLWQTKLRYYGLAIMLISVIIMLYTPKPDFIYDHRFKAVGIRDNNGRIIVYADKKLPEFTTNYWANWYGQESLEVITRQISKEDHIFYSASGTSISLNYHKCTEADVQIITSKYLTCDKAVNQVSNQELMEKQNIIIFCNKNRCKFGR